MLKLERTEFTWCSNSDFYFWWKRRRRASFLPISKRFGFFSRLAEHMFAIKPRTRSYANWTKSETGKAIACILYIFLVVSLAQFPHIIPSSSSSVHKSSAHHYPLLFSRKNIEISSSNKLYQVRNSRAPIGSRFRKTWPNTSRKPWFTDAFS